MFKSYIIVARRSIMRSKVNSLITVFGLSVGIACCLLISLYVREEWTFDQFHSKAERIYRVWAREDWGINEQFSYSSTPYAMGPTLKENFQEVETEVRFNPSGAIVMVNEKQYADPVTIVGKNFFDVFDFEIVQSDNTAPFKELQDIIITERMAKKYFGEANPIDKIISLQLSEDFEDFVVSAVVENPPTNSSLQFELLISDDNLKKFVSERALTSAWFSISPETYLLLKPGVSADELQGKFPSLFKSLLGDDYEKSKYTVMLQPLTDIHLNTSVPVAFAPVSNPMYSYILAATAILILVLACINFITISIGRSIRRSREVGIRKVVGAVKRQLMTQFVGEAVMIALMSMLLGIIMAILFLPTFNTLSQKQLTLGVNGFVGLVSAAIIILVGVLSGSYPAFVLSSLKVNSIFKGKIEGGGKHTLRRALVAVQITLGILLVTSTLVIRNQLEFLQNKDLGFDRERLAVIQLSVKRGPQLAQRIKNGFETVKIFKNELSAIPGVNGVCGTSHDFANGGWTNIGYTDDKSVYRTFDLNIVEPDYFDVLGIKTAQGRIFDKNSPSDAIRTIVVNEAFVREMGWEEPIGMRIPGKNFPDHEIIGVIKDFNYASLYTRVQPLVLAMDPAIILPGMENINIDNSPLPKLMIRLRPGSMMQTIEDIKAVWNKVTNNEEFSFAFVDQAIDAQYASDQNLGKIIGVSTLLAVMLGSLGLYGLATLSMQNKVKEISIRKVFGASQRALVYLLTKEYVVMVLISLAVSIPFTIYAMREWLSGFEYRVELNVNDFLLAGGIAMFITIATILYQTLVTTNSRPAETLKNE